MGVPLHHFGSVLWWAHDVGTHHPDRTAPRRRDGRSRIPSSEGRRRPALSARRNVLVVLRTRLLARELGGRPKEGGRRSRWRTGCRCAEKSGRGTRLASQVFAPRDQEPSVASSCGNVRRQHSWRSIGAPLHIKSKLDGLAGSATVDSRTGTLLLWVKRGRSYASAGSDQGRCQGGIPS